MSVPEPLPPHHPRHSACAEASLRAEMEQVQGMPVEERILMALGLGEKFSWLEPSPIPEAFDESS